MALGSMDFTTAASSSGARFVVLKGALARLERALAAFMLDLHVNEFGYTESRASRSWSGIRHFAGRGSC